jgi:hypothetical protein
LIPACCAPAPAIDRAVGDAKLDADGNADETAGEVEKIMFDRRPGRG